MADQKVTQLIELTVPERTDILYIVDDPGGTPASKKITLANLYSALVAADMPSEIDAAKIGSGVVSNTEFSYLNGVTAGIQTQIDLKEPVIEAGTTAQYWRGDKTWQTLNQAAVAGLTEDDSPTFAGLYLTGDLDIQEGAFITLYAEDGSAFHLGKRVSGGTSEIALRTLLNPNSGQPLFSIESSGYSTRLWVEHNGHLSTSNSKISMNRNAGSFSNLDGWLYFASDAYLFWDESEDEFVFPKDVKFNKEILGSRTSFVLSNLDGLSGPTAYLRAGETPMSAERGLVMPRPGSIVGISIMYDVVSEEKSVALEVRKNGVDVWSNPLDTTVGQFKKAYFTQARGTDTFSAGDDIEVYLNQGGGGPYTQINYIIVTLEVVYDD